MRPANTRRDYHRDPNSMTPLAGAFATQTRPVVAPVAGGPATWDRWAATPLGMEMAAAESGMAEKHGVSVRVGEPMTKMDAPNGSGGGLEGVAHSTRGRQALAAMPWWRRGLLRFLLALGAGLGRLARRVEGKNAGAASTVVRVLPREEKPPIQILPGRMGR